MFIVKIVLSLFAILFTYDAIVGEKEKGTLKLALSNDVPRDRLILGKAIGGYLSLLMPLLVPLLLSLIILLVAPNLALSGQDWGRLLLIFLMFFLYLSVFFSLGLFISARTSRSSTSFLVLLFIWVVFVMVIPKVAVITAGQIRPIPSVHEITAKKDAFLQQVQVEGQKRVREWAKKNQPAKGEDPKVFQDKFKQFIQDYQQELTSKIDENNAALERDYQLRQKAQQSLAVNLSRISPASALTFGSMTLARTGVDEYDRFLAAVRSLQADLHEVGELQARPEHQLPDGTADDHQDRRHAPVHARAGEPGQVARPDPAGLRPDGHHDHHLLRRRLRLVPALRRALR